MSSSSSSSSSPLYLDTAGTPIRCAWCHALWSHLPSSQPISSLSTSLSTSSPSLINHDSKSYCDIRRFPERINIDSSINDTRFDIHHTSNFPQTIQILINES